MRVNLALIYSSFTVSKLTCNVNLIKMVPESEGGRVADHMLQRRRIPSAPSVLSLYGSKLITPLSENQNKLILRSKEFRAHPVILRRARSRKRACAYVATVAGL